MSVQEEFISVNDFWTAAHIWIKNPHVVNRRLSGVNFITSKKLTVNKDDINSIVSELLKTDYERITSSPTSFIIKVLKIKNIDVSIQEINHEKCFEELKDNKFTEAVNLIILIQKLIPRGNKYKNGYRVCILDLEKKKVIFINKYECCDLIESGPDIPYCIQFRNGDIALEDMSDLKTTKNITWLHNTLLPKLKKWANNKIEVSGIVQGSLNLISLDKYNSKYQELKVKYGQEMVKVWPECTDPSKFVYEDVAIATYLILLWEDERIRQNKEEKQSFVDLGCGNGLLVYILASEGHPGKGVDVRKRDIWDLYPKFVKLEVESITPSAEYLYKDTDWIIGNHSDELTPWIPVIASRSSYRTNFFLLPCCAYEFNGKKYQRTDSSKSQYSEYIEYVQDICDKCGIKTSVDRLKIPSTKRICLIGTDRLFEKHNFLKKIDEIKCFVDSRCDKNVNNDLVCDKTNDDLHDCWVSDFKPRESTEKVRNCTKIEKGIIDEIVESVTINLLKEKNYLNSKWNAGGCIALNDVVKMLPSDKLKMLKQECGGLQTLLRNHHHIFEVVGGKVKLRYPRTRAEVFKQLTDKQNKTKKIKRDIVLNKKPCWFYTKHPDGCPLLETECSYIH